MEAGRIEPVAQSVEHLTFNQVAAGSSPARLIGKVKRLDRETLRRWRLLDCKLTHDFEWARPTKEQERR